MVLLNIDLGELEGEDEVLFKLAHVANVACGGHAGDETTMARAVTACRTHGTKLGAHPSYPDRQGFGRTRVTMPLEALRAAVAEQCAKLEALARVAGEKVAYVKAHGALYHAASDDEGIALALLSGAAEALGREVTVIGPARGAMAARAARAALRFAREGFADRATRADGTLVPRGQPGAVISDPRAVAARVGELVSCGEVETICVHGDNPNALAVATAARRALDELRA